MNNENNEPALTDGASASLPQQHPSLPTTEYPVEYIVIKATGVKRFSHEEIGATHDIVAGQVFKTDSEAHELARRILATEGPIVVRVPPGFKVVRQHEEIRAAKHLRAIRALITGRNEPFQVEEEMESLVDICSRVFHAYRTLRETALKSAITEALHKASTKELLEFARALSVMPEEFSNDPFDDPPERSSKQSWQPPEAGTRLGEGLRPRRA